MRGVRTISIWPFLLWLVTTASAVNPDRDIHQLAHRSWGEKEGYPGRALDLAQTTDGFLWITTDKGLFRFDGVHFERYEPRSGDKLSDGALQGLLALSDRSLWFAYRRETRICALRDDNLKCYDKADGVTSLPTAIVQDHEGTLWANTESGVVRFDGTRWKHIGKEWNFPEEVPSKNSIVLFVDSHGTLWAGVNHTVLYLKQGAKRFEPTGTFAVWSSSIAEAPDGTIWLADNFTYARALSTTISVKPAAIAKCEAEATEGAPPKCPSEVAPAFKIGGLSRVLFDHSGSLWMTSDTSGVFRVPHPERLRDQPFSRAREALEAFASKDGLSADDCYPILEDREGNIWVGTRDGLDQFRDTTLVPVTLPTSIFQAAIAPADSGDLWIVGSWAYVARIHPDSRKVSLTPAIEAFKPYRDPAGVTWLVGNSLEQWKDGRFRKVAEAPYGVLGGTGSWQIAGDKFGTLWAFSDGLGFFSLHHHRWKAWTTPRELARQHSSNIYSDSAGRIWVSTYEGDIITMDNGKVAEYPLQPDSRLRYVEAFAEHAPEEIWAGGEGGLILIKRDQLLVIRPAALDSLDNITGIVDAGSEGLWLNTSNGVIHVSSDEVGRALREPSYRFQWERFDSFDGLPGQSDVYTFPKAVQGTDGRIWFTAARGVAWIDPKKRKDLRNVLPPPVSITSVSADSSLHLQLNDLRLPAHTTNVQINYTALSLSVPERVHFRYLLEGSDNDWRDVGTRREAFYTNLGPRHYRFRVVACNSDGVWNNVGASIDFNIVPAWYQTSWFPLGCAAALLLLLWIAYMFRVRQLGAQFAAELKTRVDERTRIARELHDTLLQSFHGLMFRFQAARNMLPRDPENAVRTLEEAISSTREAIAESRDAIHDLRSQSVGEGDLAELLNAAAGEMAGRENTNGDAPTFRLVVEGEPQKLSPALQGEVFRIAREVMRNAFRHADASQIEVEIRYDKNQLRLRVRDDGKGIDPTVLEARRPGHWGLPGIRERAEQIGGHLSVWSNGRVGTEIELTVPAITSKDAANNSRFKLFRKDRAS